MNKILKFLQRHKYSVIWTICYAICTWAILYFMFKFNIFNGAQWHRLARAELRGFGGFVFGVLLLAATPLYIATTAIIVRTKKPLITIPKPKFPKIITPQKKAGEKQPENTPQPTPQEKENTNNETLSDEIPHEIRAAFIRARNKLETYAQNPSCIPTDRTSCIPVPENDILPLPTDFDIGPIDIAPTHFDTPIFTEINFDSTPNKAEETADPIPAFISNKKIIDYLTETNQDFNITDDIIVTKTHAIISHNDSDFWVIDDENWFANGKTRPSPISKIYNFANDHNLIPVIYLESTNIMDLDTYIEKWHEMGIHVITTPSEL